MSETQQITIPTFAYPFQRDKSSGNNSKTTQALYREALSKDAESQYLFNKSGLWHGGIHLKKGRFTGFDTEHIRAIADGEMVYYRMDTTFLENTLNDPNWGDYTVQYSSGFFLLKHKLEYPKDNRLTFYSLYLHTAPIGEYHFIEHEVVGESYYGRYDRDGNHDGKLDPMGEEFIKLGDQITVGKARSDLGDGRYQLLTSNSARMSSDATVHISNIAPKIFETTVKGRNPNMRRGNTNDDHSPVEVKLSIGSAITINTYQSEEQKKNKRYRVLKAHDQHGAAVAVSSKSTISASNLSSIPEESPFQSPESNGVVTKQMEERAGTNLNPTQSVSNIKAGDILGKPGIYNHDWGETELDKMIHLEVFTFDDVAAFRQKAKDAYTKNPESMSEEEKAARPKENLLVVGETEIRYSKEDQEGREPIFYQLPKETHKEYYKKVVQPLKKLKKVKDQEGKEYIRIERIGIDIYVEYKKEYEIHGITLDAFTLIDKAGAEKIGIFEEISKFYNPNPDEDTTPQQEKEQLNETFKTILESIRVDKNSDGRLQAGEFAKLSLNQDRREQLSYFAVKHESEWDADESRYQDIITYLQSNPKLTPVEAMFKDRLEKLAIWPKQILGQSATPTFFHPISFISVFEGSGGCMLNINKFITEYKKIHINWYEKNTKTKQYELIKINTLNEVSENNLKKLAKALIAYYQKSNYECSVSKLAYILATIKVESYQWKKKEYFGITSENISYAQAEIDYGCGATARRKSDAKKNGCKKDGDGYKYRGRGFVQITWKINYDKYNGINSIDFGENPDEMLNFDTQVAVTIEGMEQGLFSTGNTLSKYINDKKTDFKGARAIINGSDKDWIIEYYAKGIKKCLELAQ